ncbi:putative ribonuclease H-like domain-containing protein [Tanacetum coccineum]|uniref:Ribonuclease H-like domain-containing protein n=1 Tax=Tanacetum coccineum TaxID=301880 RepID=A0ABQ5EG30_9ASTR
MRMEQYLTHTDYDLWEVIVNGDAHAIASASAGTEGPIPPKTAKQKLARKNELKAKSTLLLAIPDEHLLKFHGIKDAKTLWEEIKARFGGNKESKKIQKTILKLKYENFTASRSEDWIKPMIDTMSMDDLYNNFKVYEAEIKSQSNSSLNSQNVAFVSSENTSNTNEALDNEDLEQIDTDDLKEMDLKWQVAMLTMRVKRFLKKTRRNLNFNSKEIVGFNKTKVKCYNYHRRCHFARECRAPRNQGNRNGNVPRRIAKEGPTNFALMAHLSSGSSSLLSSDSEVRDNSITKLKNQSALALREKNDLKLKLEKFETSSKKLTDLLNSQISVNNKTGIGFDSQMNENELHDIHKNNSEVFVSVSDSIPPPYTGNYMPSRPDLSFAGLDDYVYKTNVSETIISVPRNESTASKSSKDNLEQPKDVRPSAPIIEEWESGSDDDCVIRASFEQNKPSYAKINFVKSDENTRKSVIEQHTNRQAENLRKSQSPRVDKRNWNGLMTQKLGDGFEFNKKACFVCGSLNHLIKDCNFYENKMVGKSMLNNMGRVTGQREVRPVWNNAQRVNHQNKLSHPHPKRNFVPTAVLTKSGNVPVNTAKQSSSRAAVSNSTARYVNTVASRPTVNGAKPSSNIFHKLNSSVKRTIYQRTTPKNSDFKEKVNTAKVNNVTTSGTKAVVSDVHGHEENVVKSSACWIWRPTGKVIDHISENNGSYIPKRFDYGNPQHDLQDQGIFDSGYSRHMTGNKFYLSDYQDIDGGFVAFAGSPKGGKITEKGKIKTGKLDFKDVYFVKKLKFNLFSVSQMCDKKNSVLFTETECLILSPDFKLLDESQVLLKVPRQNNMYSFNLKNVVPSGGLTCLFAKATIDESNLWHRRLGHINFKTMNKLVKGNLVRGLPSKLFENDHTCVACQKGKQHKASCKTKLVSSISQPLQMLHMDLFGPTFVNSLNKKMYCLVVTDDFSRFSWVFFLASKDETCRILKTFITGIENQINHRVKIIRCDNGTEFKNNEMNQFCQMKGIKREFSVARTPQQNGVAERKNRTLIEVFRTMLANLLLPTIFWDEVNNTACYVQKRVLVTKPHNKTPYELLIGRPPNLDFMRPFGCPVTILNTLDLLGKFEGKADEGFLVGYSVNSKAFRVFNTRTRKVEENLHVKFLENKSNVAGSGPEWLFDIDSLTKSMNYEPVTAGNQTNGDAGIETNDNAGQAGQEKAADHEYILLPFLTSDSSSTQSSDDKDADEVPGKGDEGVNKVSGSDDQERTDSSTQDINTAGPSINTASTNINTGSLNINTVSPNDPNMPSLEETGIFDGAYDDEDVGAEADLNNLETTMNVSPIPTTRIHKDHPKDQIIGDLNLSTQTRRMINFSEENAMVIQALTDPSWIEAMQEELLQFKLQKVWTLVDLPKGKRAIGTKWVYRNKKDERGIIVRNKARLFPDKVYEVEKALYGLHQALRAWYETLSSYLLENGYRRGSIDKTLFIKKDKDDAQEIPDEFYEGLTFFLGLQAASTPIETNKALNKDEEAEDVDVHLYRSMIGSLMYLTASRPNIMFAVCAYARFQVTPKTSHLHAVKRIFRYLKEQPKLGLWYPRDSPFDLEAFSDSDYAGASLDRKSTTGGCQFLGKRLISWHCKKQTIVANSTTEAEDSYEKKLIQVIKIHTDHNVTDILTKAFDVSRPFQIVDLLELALTGNPQQEVVNFLAKGVMDSKSNALLWVQLHEHQDSH